MQLRTAMQQTFTCGLLFLVLLLSACQEALELPAAPEAAREFVEASARYHDPAGLWPAFRAELDMHTLNDDGAIAWTNELYFDRSRDTFRRQIMADGFPLVQTVGPTGVCRASWPNPSATQIELLRNGLLEEPCAYILWRQRFYDFLVGLPMVALEGDGHFRENVPLVNSFGKDCYEVEVRFGDSPTEPTWQLYFEPESYRLHSAKFFRASGSGEWIHYPSDVQFGNFKLKQSQTWYHVDGRRQVSRDSFAYQALVR